MFKEIVEELFTEGLIKAVFATETLALGINMPARTVVIERLVKWNGEMHADLTPGEYTQLTGRAGRRGIDVEGHAVVLWHPRLRPAAGGRPRRHAHVPAELQLPPVLQHGGQPRRPGRPRTRPYAAGGVVRAVPGGPRRRGPGAAAAAQRGGAGGLPRGHDLPPGRLHGVRRAAAHPVGPREVTSPANGPARSAPRPRAPSNACAPATSSSSRTAARRAWHWFSNPAPPTHRRPRTSRAHRQPAGQAARTDRLPRHRRAGRAGTHPGALQPQIPQHRRDLASTLRNKTADLDIARPPRAREPAGEDPEITALRRRLREHACHGCAEREDHARWAERYFRLERETAACAAASKAAPRSSHGPSTGSAPCSNNSATSATTRSPTTAAASAASTPSGPAHRRMPAGRHLGRPGPRRARRLRVRPGLRVPPGRRRPRPENPVRPVQGALTEMIRLSDELKDIEKDHRVSFLREPDMGFVWAAHRWARGHQLDAVLTDTDRPPATSSAGSNTPRPTRPDRRRRPTRQRPPRHRGQGNGPDPPRRRRLLVRHLTHPHHPRPTRPRPARSGPARLRGACSARAEGGPPGQAWPVGMDHWQLGQVAARPRAARLNAHARWR